MKASVDVILPVFGGEQTLSRAVMSVVSQLGKHNVHLYCIDDGSNDNSASLLLSLAGHRSDMTVVINSENIGVSASRNLGVSMGTSDFVCFIDQDDEWVHNKLDLQMSGFSDNRAIRYSTGLQHILLEENTPRPNWCRQEWLEQPMSGFLPSTLMMTRATWDFVGAFDPTLRAGGDDLEWFARARRLGIEHCAVPDVVVRRYISGRNLSSDAIRTTQELLTVVRRQLPQKRVES
jgi:glycosyltransferase involved in cell wall biosynthesis